MGILRGWAVLMLALALAACGPSRPERVFAPGLADREAADGLETGHRLMAAGEPELALRAYQRAVAERGLDVDTLSALGSANLALGRLGQAERFLRRATTEAPDFPPAWNNLGVLLMERGEYAEAVEVFRRAFATDSGNSEEIRANLAGALAKRDGSLTDKVNLVLPDAPSAVIPLDPPGSIEPL